MLIIPAIDLRNGKVVRLFQGKFDQEKVYSNDPVKVAKYWVRQGAKFLHIVDLDGASSGVPKNLEVLKKIITQVCVPLEFGGGVRSMETISELLNLGVQRVVLGTRAVNDAQFLKKACKKFGENIIVSIDARGKKVLTQGWNKTVSKTILDFAKELKEVGFKQLIYTDISKDGALVGPNILGIKELIRKTGLDVIASGGVASLKDLLKLKCLQKKGLSGVIIGKALYEGKFTLVEALKLS
ncbi:MAG: 1-(5-phosphoribosyl)-5-[(5-phosphoribosylamino)methylideneamino]imidazole-4-carboxamide isomerase [Candidatus Omnitrophica bacterium]|nr:1-(5-phosphoribosyl)-5-[(5-phosphoribosylamino)methylideneamino]imidazole-4-carboxamide isomerase [Candidatus Omnitrophota bacterium]MBU1923696.1 1-(5-phosphoribosyl)-5-[(5-phosphoribosylamino)methylideneamino]imidazole-4-carboxamide isomerase [Candidatus Omnitrophota bacterium]